MADAQAPARDPDLVAFGAFSNGVRNDVTAERLGPNDLALGDNIDLDNTGRVSRRSGRTKKNSTPTHSAWGDGLTLGFCVQGTQLFKINTDYTLTVMFTGLTLGRAMSYRKVNDNVYMSNGREKLVHANGQVRAWGLAVPQVLAMQSSGTLPPGRYQFTATYVRNDGQESGAAVAVALTVSPDPLNPTLTTGFALSVPPSTDATVIGCNFYASGPYGTELYLIGSGVPAYTAAFGRLTDLTNYELQLQFLTAPPAGQIVGYYSGRMFLLADDLLFYSEPFAYELFDPRKYIPLDGRGTLFAVMEDKETLDQPGQNSGAFVGTDRSCGILVGSTPEDFQYVPKMDYGAVEGALDYVDGSLFGDGQTGARRLPVWLSAQGLCVGMPGMEIRNITRNRFAFSAGGRGAALFEPNPNRFIAISNF